MYEDLWQNYVGGIYTHVSGNLVGSHCVEVIGYDDGLPSHWICKNSWGPNWGEGGYFRIAYGQCGIDDAMWEINQPLDIPPAIYQPVPRGMTVSVASRSVRFGATTSVIVSATDNTTGDLLADGTVYVNGVRSGTVNVPFAMTMPPYDFVRSESTPLRPPPPPPPPPPPYKWISVEAPGYDDGTVIVNGHR